MIHRWWPRIIADILFSYDISCLAAMIMIADELWTQNCLILKVISVDRRLSPMNYELMKNILYESLTHVILQGHLIFLKSYRKWIFKLILRFSIPWKNGESVWYSWKTTLVSFNVTSYITTWSIGDCARDGGQGFLLWCFALHWISIDLIGWFLQFRKGSWLTIHRRHL